MGASVRGRSGRISAVAWSGPEGLAYGDWMLEGKRLGVMWRASPWWIGDWLLYGSSRWGETYAQAARVTGYDPKSLRNMRYVSSRFDASLRRDNLTWSHHALLAGFEPAAREYWLARAGEDRLSVDDLRVELRAARRVDRGDARELAACAAQGERVVVCPNCGDSVPVPAA